MIRLDVDIDELADQKHDDAVVRVLDDETEAREFCCPECGGDTGVQKFSAHDSFIGIDTSVRYCTECDWRGDPE